MFGERGMSLISVPNIPVEIFDRILSYVVNLQESSDQTPTLSSCYRVCRSWNISTLPHYFKSASIFPSDSRSITLCSLIDSREAIGKAIEILVFQGDFDETKPDDDPWMDRAVERLCGRLPNVHTIAIGGLHQTGKNITPQLFSNLSHFHKVTQLNMIGCILPQTLLTTYISCFPNVEELVLFGVADPEELPNLFKSEREVMEAGYSAPAVKSFRAKGIPLVEGGMLSWLSMEGSPSKRSLQRVCICVQGWEPDAADKFLCEVGGTLRELDIKIVDSHDYGTDGDFEVVNIRSCISLRSLTIRTALSRGTPLILDNLSSPHLESIGFSVPPIEDSHLDTYKALCDHLCGLRLPKDFQGVRFIYKGAYGSTGDARMKLEKLFEGFRVKYEVMVVHTANVHRWWFCLDS